MASWLVCSPLGTGIGLSPVWRHCVVIMGKRVLISRSQYMHLPTRVYKWVPVNMMLREEVNPVID